MSFSVIHIFCDMSIQILCPFLFDCLFFMSELSELLVCFGYKSFVINAFCE